MFKHIFFLQMAQLVCVNCVCHMDKLTDSGDYKCYVEFDGISEAVAFRTYPAEADGDVNFPADGVTVNTYVTRANLYKGTIGDNIGDVATLVVPNTGSQSISFTEYDAPKLKLNLMERYNGSWEPIQDGAVYVAPDGFQHLCGCKTVYCQRQTGDGGSGTDEFDVADGFTLDRLRHAVGGVENGATGEFYIVGYFADTNFYCRAKANHTTNKLQLERGSQLINAGDEYEIWYYFTVQ